MPEACSMANTETLAMSAACGESRLSHTLAYMDPRLRGDDELAGYQTIAPEHQAAHTAVRMFRTASRNLTRLFTRQIPGLLRGTAPAQLAPLPWIQGVGLGQQSIPQVRVPDIRRARKKARRIPGSVGELLLTSQIETFNRWYHTPPSPLITQRALHAPNCLHDVRRTAGRSGHDFGWRLSGQDPGAGSLHRRSDRAGGRRPALRGARPCGLRRLS